MAAKGDGDDGKQKVSEQKMLTYPAYFSYIGPQLHTFIHRFCSRRKRLSATNL